jgi:isoprenylcysteine carboxyl methyltransferase (ICMT) family protein YpbQ
MPTLNNFITLLWIVFVVYWFVSAIGVKENVKGGSWAHFAGFRILLAVIIVILLQASSFWVIFAYQFDFGVRLTGIILCALGIGIAIWARVHLGRNWSGTPSIKKDHELVTSGPYRFVRHPIYTGMVLALFGSALTAGVIWFVVFILFTANFLYRIPVEERYMMQLFPDQYPGYKKRTKALIPFVW